MRIVVLADSDSYVKWGAALAGALSGDWHRELLVVESQFTVNDSQLTSALRGTGIDEGERVPYLRLSARLAELAPDAVLVAAPGPVSMVLIRLVAKLERRPVIVSGLPGISIPVTVKALRFRRQSDLMVVHSHREVREFTELSRSRGWDHRLGLARLPFASARPAAGTDLVFAPQAVVPRRYDDRVEVARILREAALADPSRRVVVKLRARLGERSTHPEADAFPDLMAALGAVPENLVFTAGPMDEALDTAAGLVTVSSTSAVEAIARGIPVIALDTFGVSSDLINPVFEGSGLFGGRTAVVEREFRHPAAEWLSDNYFHDEAEAVWETTLEDLIWERRTAALAPRPARIARGGLVREAWDRKVAFGAADRSVGGFAALAVGYPLRATVRSYRWARRVVRTQLGAVVSQTP